MRTFKEPNTSNDWKCPICDTNDVKEVVLIGVIGTQKGGCMEAEQVHLGCIDLRLDKTLSLIYQNL